MSLIQERQQQSKLITTDKRQYSSLQIEARDNTLIQQQESIIHVILSQTQSPQRTSPLLNTINLIKTNISLTKILIFTGILFLILYGRTIYYDLYTLTPEEVALFTPHSLKTVATGELQYPRIPQEYWEQRIKMLKAMGPNAVSVYTFWNHHQVEKGVFDFQSYGKNLTYFLELIKQNGMKVWIRPGPYICAQWEFGGLPARLLTIPHIDFRDLNEIFLQETKIYFEAVSKIIKPYTEGQNPLIELLQIQNQYSYYKIYTTSDVSAYIPTLSKMWLDLGINTQQSVVDPWFAIPKQIPQDFVIGINGNPTDIQIANIHNRHPNNKIVLSEVYVGWFDKVGQPRKPINTEIAKQTSHYLSLGIPFTLYMAHGGTSFGLTTGGSDEDKGFTPVSTDCDWSAPINQAGNPTKFYHQIREVFSKYYSPKQLPPIPPLFDQIQIPPFTLQLQATIVDSLGDPLLTNVWSPPPSFQSPELRMYNQGMMVYETFLSSGNYVISLIARDVTLVYLNGKHLKTLYYNIQQTQTVELYCAQKENRLIIVIEAMGHIHFGWQYWANVKGMVSVTIKDNKNYIIDPKWSLYPIHLNQTTQLFQFNKVGKYGAPALYKATVQLQKVGDTYFDMSNFQKGYLWINGHNLGRYWNINAEKRMYCPGVWLKKGPNDVRVLEILSKINNPIIEGKLASNRYQKL